MFYRLRDTLTRFMMGRYGTDRLNHFLAAVYLVLWLVGLFARGLAHTILYWLSLAVLIWLVYRTLSRDIPRRQAENQWFLTWWTPCGAWLRRQYDRLRDVRRWRYRRCPACNAYLRLPIKRGRRTVTCARCHTQFKAFFL